MRKHAIHKIFSNPKLSLVLTKLKGLLKITLHSNNITFQNKVNIFRNNSICMHK